MNKYRFCRGREIILIWRKILIFRILNCHINSYLTQLVVNLLDIDWNQKPSLLDLLFISDLDFSHLKSVHPSKKSDRCLNKSNIQFFLEHSKRESKNIKVTDFVAVTIT